MKLLLFFLKQEEMAVTDEMDQLEQRLGIRNYVFFLGWFVMVYNILSELVLFVQYSLSYRYNLVIMKQIPNCWNKSVPEGITGLKRPNPSNRIQF